MILHFHTTKRVAGKCEPSKSDCWQRPCRHSVIRFDEVRIRIRCEYRYGRAPGLQCNIVAAHGIGGLAIRDSGRLLLRHCGMSIGIRRALMMEECPGLAILAGASRFFGVHLRRNGTSRRPVSVRRLRRPGASILPGGRIIAPTGEQFAAGPGPFGLAISRLRRYGRYRQHAARTSNSLTMLERGKRGQWEVRQLPADRTATLPENSANPIGAASRLEWPCRASMRRSCPRATPAASAIFDWSAGRRRAIDLNQGGFDDSYTGDLAFDADRGMLYVVDQANFRVAVIETRSRQVIASVRGRPPALCPGALSRPPQALRHQRRHVRIPGDSRRRSASRRAHTGLPFPAFGFPSAEATVGRGTRHRSGAPSGPGPRRPERPANRIRCAWWTSPTPPRRKWRPSFRTGPAVRARESMAAAAPPECWPPPAASSSRTPTTIPSP